MKTGTVLLGCKKHIGSIKGKVGLGAIQKDSKKKMILYKVFDNVLTTKDGKEVYIYEKGVLYDTDRYGKKTTSHRMSKIDLVIKNRK